jgi:hypothetical protein
MIVHTSI